MNISVQKALGLVSLLIIGFVALSITSNVAQLATFTDRAIPGAGVFIFWLLIAVFTLLAVMPVFFYLRLPKPLIPPEDKTSLEYTNYLGELLKQLKGNPLLVGVQLEQVEDVPAALEILSEKAMQIVKDTSASIFVSTAVMQNGRLDGLVVLGSQIRMIWRIASVFNQRPSPRQMLYLYGNVGSNVLVAENIEGVNFAEISAPIVASIFPSLKGAVPGLQGISTLLVNSMANGAANAFLTLRIGLLTKAYCESTVRPSADIVRHSSTIAAIALVGEIVKEQGVRVANQVWGVIKGSITSAADSAIENIKSTTAKAGDSITANASKAGERIANIFRSNDKEAINSNDQNKP